VVASAVVPVGPAPAFLSPKAAATYLGVSQSLLAQLRMKGTGPIYATFGRAVRYRLTDLDAWAAGRQRRSTTEVDA
jgi:excisionase family DNA binding protein